eukprot:jgi/Tetstr1/462881/TSEL_007830.t1
MQHVAKDIDPELSFDLVEQVTMVCVEHEDIVTGSGRKRRRPSASVTANRLLHVNVHDVMEDVPTRHFKFEVTLQAVRRARAHVVNVFDRMKAAQSTKNLHYPPPRDFATMDAKDKLHNLLLDWLREHKAGWTRAEAGNEGKTFVKEVTAALFPLSSDMFDRMSDPKNAGTKFFGHKLPGKKGPEIAKRLEASSTEFAAALNNTENKTWMERDNMRQVCTMLQDLRKSVEHYHRRLYQQGSRQKKVHEAEEPLRRPATAVRWVTIEALPLGKVPHRSLALLDRKLEDRHTYRRLQAYRRRNRNFMPFALSVEKLIAKVKKSLQVKHGNNLEEQEIAIPSIHKNIRQYSVLVKMLLEDAGCPELHVSYVSSDDKAKVGVGEPNLPISLAARGKASLVPVDDNGKSFNDAGDHDYSGQSVVPSVHLISELTVPAEDRNVDLAKPALYRGTAHVALKDAVFQPSTPMRHMAELGNAISKQLLDKSKLCVVTMYRDGGPDHNCKHLSVQMALLAFFIYMGLDTMVVGRTAPQQSWGNEAERVMSVLNLGLQGCALSRTLMDAAFEKVMATCGGMKAIRKAEHESRNRALAQQQQQQQRQQQQQPDNNNTKVAQLAANGVEEAQPTNNTEEAQLADSGAEEAQLANSGAEEAQLADSGNAEAHMADSGDAEAQLSDSGAEGAQPIDSGVEEEVQYIEEEVMDMVSEDSGDPDFVASDGDADIDMPGVKQRTVLQAAAMAVAVAVAVAVARADGVVLLTAEAGAGMLLLLVPSMHKKQLQQRHPLRRWNL